MTYLKSFEGTVRVLGLENNAATCVVLRYRPGAVGVVAAFHPISQVTGLGEAGNPSRGASPAQGWTQRLQAAGSGGWFQPQK